MGYIFVFGSNLAGIHGAGAALTARTDYGAVVGVGSGRTGMAYAIPTKDAMLHTLPIKAIRPHVQQFLAYAAERSRDTFRVTRVGCGLAGYKDKDMAPLFKGAPRNCLFSAEWKDLVRAQQHRAPAYLPPPRQVKSVEEEELKQLVQDCRDRRRMLTAWEWDFVVSVEGQLEEGKVLSKKQKEVLGDLWDKATEVVHGVWKA